MNWVDKEQGGERLTDRLLRPVPSMNALREDKGSYRSLPIDEAHEKYSERLVNLADYHIAGQSYYSRPNAATGEAVAGVPKEIMVRLSVAETLVGINEGLKDPVITEFFGSEVELYAEEGMRLLSVQTDLYENLMPALVRSQHPMMSEVEVRDHASTLVSQPTTEHSTPPPHRTGGAIDVILRYAQPTLDFVEGAKVPMGHTDGNTDISTYPDFFENIDPSDSELRDIQRNRRAFYNIMTGHAFGIETHLSVNPTEFWHWSQGDQLAMQVSGRPAYYSYAAE